LKIVLTSAYLISITYSNPPLLGEVIFTFVLAHRPHARESYVKFGKKSHYFQGVEKI